MSMQSRNILYHHLRFNRSSNNPRSSSCSSISPLGTTSAIDSTQQKPHHHQQQRNYHKCHGTLSLSSPSKIIPTSWNLKETHEQHKTLSHILQMRYLSSSSEPKKDDTDDTTTNNNNTTNESKKESFEETIKRLQNEKNDDTNSSSSSSSSDDMLRNVSSAFQSFSSSLSDTWDELMDSNKAQDVNKKMSDIIHPSKPGNVSDDDNEAADKYEGTTAVMVIDEEENLNAYERIQKRLSEAPLIQDIFKRAEEVYEKSGASKAREKISHVTEDAREAWETSQNPWVYRISSVYDTITAESDTAMAERELRELDPTFSLEEWKRGLVEVTLPNIMQLFLEGRIKELKPSLGEAVYNRLAAESRARKKEGVYIDTNVLGIMNSEILNCMPDTVNKGSPIITLHFMCQQINCVRKKETDEIVEGSEDDIRAYSYVVALQREYDEEKGELNWKIQDFMLNGAIAYL